MNDAKELYTFKVGTPERRIFKLYTLAMGTTGKSYKREIKLVIEEAAKIGGIDQILLATFTFAYSFFG